MGDVVTATRQVIQDLLAPELRALKARLDVLEAKVDQGFQRTEESSRDLRGEVNAGFSELRMLLAKQMDYVELRERIARVEAQNQVLATKQAESASAAAAH
jgi:hypothetical protein